MYLFKFLLLGAATQLFVLTNPATQPLSGIYWNHCCPCEPIPAAVDLELSIKLDQLSQNLIRDFI